MTLIRFLPGDVLVLNEQANSPKVWKDDSPFGDEVAVEDLSESDMMLVIAMRGNYSFVLLRGTLGYINNLCVQHAFTKSRNSSAVKPDVCSW